MTASPSTTPGPASSAGGAQPANWVREGIFIACLAFATSPWSNPPLALAIGMLLALVGLSAFEKRGKKVSRFLIQACVVLLGLRVDLHEVGKAAAEGVWLAVGTIVGALSLGFALGRLLKVQRDVSLLVSSGTAICGGSAIAAVGASIGAASSTMAVATGAVFVLNAIALYAFPPLGKLLELSPAQFGTWCGVAVHDMSSVNGAAKVFGGEALDIANVVKLTRVLWIAPIAIGAGWWWRRRAGAADAQQAATSSPKRPASLGAVIPWFIVLFIAASAARTWRPELAQWSDIIKRVAGHGFQAALFLIGAGLSKKALREVGWRALASAAILWVVVAGISLVVIRQTVK